MKTIVQEASEYLIRIGAVRYYSDIARRIGYNLHFFSAVRSGRWPASHRMLTALGLAFPCLDPHAMEEGRGYLVDGEEVHCGAR